MKNCLVILSGGMDSGTLLGWLCNSRPKSYIKGGEKISAVTFDYGSNHGQQEIAAAKRLTTHYGVPWTLIDIKGPMSFIPSALTGGADMIPDGHYEDESMRKTVVPFRNGIMLSIAAGIVAGAGGGTLFAGVHAGDHAIYPDCRLDFVNAMGRSISSGTDGAVDVECPFVDMNKADILELGLRIGMPYQHTWTCYKGREKACGTCGSCHERLEAFEKMGAKDPVQYEEV
jgi:7-cyano-7-deazaguanine synthase